MTFSPFEGTALFYYCIKTNDSSSASSAESWVLTYFVTKACYGTGCLPSLASTSMMRFTFFFFFFSTSYCI